MGSPSHAEMQTFFNRRSRTRFQVPLDRPLVPKAVAISATVVPFRRPLATSLLKADSRPPNVVKRSC